MKRKLAAAVAAAGLLAFMPVAGLPATLPGGVLL